MKNSPTSTSLLCPSWSPCTPCSKKRRQNSPQRHPTKKRGSKREPRCCVSGLRQNQESFSRPSRGLGRIGAPGSAQPQAPHPASRNSGKDASGDLPVLRFGLARAHGVAPPCEPGSSQSRRQHAVGSWSPPHRDLLAALRGKPASGLLRLIFSSNRLNYTRMRVVG